MTEIRLVALVTEDVAAQVRSRAERSGRSVSSWVRLAVMRQLAEAAIRERLDAEAGLGDIGRHR